MMSSGKTLPSYPAYDPSPRAGAFRVWWLRWALDDFAAVGQ